MKRVACDAPCVGARLRVTWDDTIFHVRVDRLFTEGGVQLMECHGEKFETQRQTIRVDSGCWEGVK